MYQVFTKCDSIPYFPDFFRRLPEREVNDVFGCTLPFELGLLTEPEPVKTFPLRVSHSGTGRTWPDYARCVQGAPPTNDKSGPDISRADYMFAIMAARRNWGAEDIAVKLMELSSKAHDNGESYARRTAQNAVAAVDRERERQRSRA